MFCRNKFSFMDICYQDIPWCLFHYVAQITTYLTKSVWHQFWSNLCSLWRNSDNPLSKYIKSQAKFKEPGICDSYSNTHGLGWILLANQIAWLLDLVTKPKPTAKDNQYASHLFTFCTHQNLVKGISYIYFTKYCVRIGTITLPLIIVISPNPCTFGLGFQPSSLVPSLVSSQRPHVWWWFLKPKHAQI